MVNKKKVNNKNEIFYSEELYKEFAKLNRIGIDLIQLDIDSTNKQLEFWDNCKKRLYQNEPIRIFRKTHKKWENEIENIENKMHKLYIQLETEITDLNDLLATKEKQKF